MDEIKREYNKAYYELYKETHKASMNKWRTNKLNKEVDDNNKCCTRCYKIQPINMYGEYEGMVKVDGQLVEAMMPYKSCVDCRNRDKARRRGS